MQARTDFRAKMVAQVQMLLKVSTTGAKSGASTVQLPTKDHQDPEEQKVQGELWGRLVQMASMVNKVSSCLKTNSKC